MAITKIATPDVFSPAYNTLKHIYSSNNVNNTGFKFVFDVYENGGSKFAEYRVLPRATDGYGEVDLSKLLQNKVTYQYPSGTTQIAVPNSAYNYVLKIGEEYVTEFAWTATLADNSGYTSITCTHSFVVGDRVVLDSPLNPSLTGLFTVTSITGTTEFTVNCLWSTIADATGDGTARYSDNRKTVNRDLRTETAEWVVDSAVTFGNFVDWDGSIYLLSTNTDKFLTTIPRSYTITDTQDIYFLTGNNNVVNGYIYFENDGGDVLRYAVTNNDKVTMCNVGANAVPNLIVSGTGGHIKATTNYYDVWFTNSAGVQHSEKIRFNIDRRCKFNDYEIMFYDRLGSWGSFSFSLKQYTEGTVNKQQFNKDIVGSVVSSEWLPSKYEAGQTVVFPQADEILRLNSNYLDRDAAIYFSELLSTPQAYIKINNVYFACIVQDTGYNYPDERNTKLIRKEITVKLSNQAPING